MSMDPLIETIDLDLEESNELAFKIKVEGAAPVPAKVRLVCEGSDMAYMFNGHGTSEEGVVQFVLPQMKDKLQEGVYQARVEVLIDNRYFAPVQFQVNFKKAVKVVAESMFVMSKSSKQDIKVTASPVIVSKQNLSPQPIIVEQKVSHLVVDQKPKTPEVNESMLPAREAANMTLKERYSTKQKSETSSPQVEKPKTQQKQKSESLSINDLTRMLLKKL